MRVLADTNILLRSAQTTHPLRSHATQAVSRLIRQGHSVFYCSQNIAEFWNVATRPADKNGLGLSHEEVIQEIASIESLLTLLPDVPAIFPVWKLIVKDHKVQGVKVYDARLFAIMRVYAVETVLTFNDSDFKRFDGITALNPTALPA